MRCAMNALVGNIPNPLSQPTVQVVEACRFTTLKATQEVPTHVLHARFDLALRLCPIWPAQSRTKAPIPREIQKHRIPHDLATIVRSQPDRLHPVVENLLRYPTQLAEGFFVHAEQGSQRLIQCSLGHHGAAITQREREPP